MGFEPRCLGFHYIVGGCHALFIGQCGRAQIFVGFLKVHGGHAVGGIGLLSVLHRLVYLQFNHIAGVGQFEFAYQLGALGCLVFGIVAAPVPDGNGQSHTHRKASSEFLFKTVVHVGVAEAVRTNQCQIGQHRCPCHVLLLACYVGGKPQGADVGAAVVHLLHIVAAHCFGCRHGRGVDILVGQRKTAVDRQAAYLGQSHARQTQTVLHFHQVDLSRVQLHVHAEPVRHGGHTGFHHQVYIVLQSVEQVHIALCELVLGFERHHLPVSGIDRIHHILGLADVHLSGQLLGKLG